MVTSGYKRLQEVQGVTVGYNGLQGVTRDYKGGKKRLQGVT